MVVYIGVGGPYERGTIHTSLALANPLASIKRSKPTCTPALRSSSADPASLLDNRSTASTSALVNSAPVFDDIQC